MQAAKIRLGRLAVSDIDHVHLLATSSTDAPLSACHTAKAPCSFVKHLRGVAFHLLQGSGCPKNLRSARISLLCQGNVITTLHSPKQLVGIDGLVPGVYNNAISQMPDRCECRRIRRSARRHRDPQ